VETGRAELILAIDLDSDPICGSVTRAGGEPQSFCGWIDLVEAIEDVRASATTRKRLGWLPGAKVPSEGLS
jgi:hypothetical protein